MISDQQGEATGNVRNDDFFTIIWKEDVNQHITLDEKLKETILKINDGSLIPRKENV